MTKILGSIDPELLKKLADAIPNVLVGEAKAQETEPPGLWEVLHITCLKRWGRISPLKVADISNSKDCPGFACSLPVCSRLRGVNRLDFCNDCSFSGPRWVHSSTRLDFLRAGCNKSFIKENLRHHSFVFVIEQTAMKKRLAPELQGR
jgi:hypothetical protein